MDLNDAFAAYVANPNLADFDKLLERTLEYVLDVFSGEYEEHYETEFKDELMCFLDMKIQEYKDKGLPGDKTYDELIYDEVSEALHDICVEAEEAFHANLESEPGVLYECNDCGYVGENIWCPT
ncbi:hypothetical protein, partial [Nitrosomonas sp.]|uniref:hypothetical protein n=1 Tax=Nitrosomonas sp. TaxID=42353 RepID=UPI001D4FAC8D